MKKNELMLITGTEQTKMALYEQLLEQFKDYLSITAYSLEKGLPGSIHTDTVLLSSPDLREEVTPLLSNDSGVIEAVRTIRTENLEPLLHMPGGSNVLVVSDTADTASELISQLKELGIHHVHFIPYEPDKLYIQDADLIISPGEMHLAPDGSPMKLDIGVRLIGFPTIQQLVNRFDLSFLNSILTERQMKQAFSMQQKLTDAKTAAITAEKNLELVVDQVGEGVIGVRNGFITVFNSTCETIFQIKRSDMIQQPIQHSPLPDSVAAYVMNGSDPFQLFQIHGLEAAIYRKESNGIITATISRVSKAAEINEAAAIEWRKKGFTAKYTFDHIIGEHPAIKDTVSTAKKLAISDLPVLIEGETGTGKELFAQAIHNGSGRRTGPFVAVNCSALSPSLFESELFGYETGAFTGAQRGGKKGLFEQADGGTLFLDEIGDVSQELQASLLRVLQEKEIRRISGTRNVAVDVRIVAATNMNLREKMAEGAFRADLFYRLNVFSIQIPPLRERKTDIPILAEEFLKRSGTMTRMDTKVMDMLKKEDWDGNVRELKNSIDYMLAVSDGKTIHLHDLPGKTGTKQKKKEKEAPAIKLTLMDKQEYVFILETIRISNENGEPASRRIISEISKSGPIPLTAQQVRHRLDFLEKHSYVTKGRGRAGTKITLEGMDFLHSLKSHLGND
ncbi:AAA family ATPase [Bacillus sp. FJAT-42376]|uniref:sigma-54 interaction domain-containing protein n=1 Tax=Bacillus sp. FJAT-42376 TaxID=2014076 RepID=UPI000F4F329C|nr:sigma 54-interacting transcriptional regulator [Bacillus sp. FJAT-42376]AZB43252.1 AAA family ATPase [Bacillus sp. FJAT-42376]